MLQSIARKISLILPETFRLAWLLTLLLLGVSSLVSAQKRVVIKLTIVDRQATSATSHDVGILLDVDNQSDQDVALFTPLGELTNYVRYYKIDPKTRQYRPLVHPLYRELMKERALKDSLWKRDQLLADFFSIDNYNWKSALYREFVQDDSLWYDHSFRSTSQYEKSIQYADIERFRKISGTTEKVILFTMMKASERFQDFMNVGFLYEEKGEYKIVLELPVLDLHQAVCQVGSFLVKEPRDTVSSEIYLSVR